ncbi:MAG TPA: YggT family protein [Patescibacteria group bacterium]|nr:YggT family protein [Patescibacteria group bacterium]
MADNVQDVTETTTRSGDTVQRNTRVARPHADAEHDQNVAERAVWLVAGVLLAVLGLRFLLSLMGANTTNAFANFIYSISHPFVAPFFSLFSYNTQITGASRFEAYTLVAMVVYALIAWGIAKLVTINRE